MKVTGKIFIADNDPGNRELLKGHLEALKCDFISARDGLDAWKHIQKDTPDLILVNTELPGMDGYELCRRIKNDKIYSDIPVIITGTSDESFDKAEAFRIGVSDYLLKPFVKEEVLSRVKTHLEHHVFQNKLNDFHSDCKYPVNEQIHSLKESEATLIGFIEGSDDAICIRDCERRLVLWNQVFARSIKENCGVDIQKGMRAEDYVPEALFAGFSDQRKKLYRALQGESQSAVFDYPLPDVTTRYFHVSWFPVYVDEEVISVAEISRDITEQEATRQQLQEAEKRYQTVADFTFDWEYWEDPEGKLIYVSPSCERITGYIPSEFEEKPELIQDIIRPEDRNNWYDHRGLEDNHRFSKRISFRIQKKDGTIRWIEHACLPVYDEEGSYLGIRASNRDITKRKFAEIDLKKKDDLLTEAQSIANMGSWEWDIQTNTLTWSDEIFKMFGVSLHEFTPTYEAFLEMIHPDDRSLVQQAVNAAISDSSKSYNVIHRIVKPDGIERIVRERGKVKYDNTGQAESMIGTVQDVTEIKTNEAERQSLRQELSRMDRIGVMGVMTAGIAHEINQPLTAILSNAQASKRFMENDTPDLEEVNDALLDIIADTKRAGKIVHTIRSMMGKSSELRREKIELNAAIREILTLTRNEVLRYNITLQENLQIGLPYIYGDRIQIQQVLINLIKNAMDAIRINTYGNPEILISSSFRKDKSVRVSVEDSGPGIETEDLTKIFKGFHTRKKQGLGIGLAVCSSIVQNHGGRIWAENRPEGGAVFFFQLPVEEK